MAGQPKLAVLISGTGRNLQAIINAVACGQIAAEPVLVVSNRAQAFGLQRAQQAGIPTAVVSGRDHASREAYDAALIQRLDASGAELIALAGFMRILSPGFVRHYRGRLFNIHPSLLPKYRGLDTHARALAAGDCEHGASVHFVTEELDGGPVIIQGKVAMVAGDSAEQLARRVLEQVELTIYPQALALAAAGRVTLNAQDQVMVDGKPLQKALLMDGKDNPIC